MTRAILLSVVLCCMSAGAQAGGAGDPVASKTSFAALLADLEPGGRYPDLSTADRRDARQAVLRMQRRLDSAGGAHRLSAKARVAVFNDQELVNGLLTGADPKDRVVCRHERRTGSHRDQSACLTVAERRQAYDHAMDMFRDMPPSGGGP